MERYWGSSFPESHKQKAPMLGRRETGFGTEKSYANIKLFGVKRLRKFANVHDLLGDSLERYWGSSFQSPMKEG